MKYMILMEKVTSKCQQVQEGGKPEDPEEKTPVITRADQNKTNTQIPCSAGKRGLPRRDRF